MREARVKFEEVNDEILKALQPAGRTYWVVVTLLALGVVYAAAVWAYQILAGLGIGGWRPPVMWGTDLINFVFWIGIAHSGTFISAILYLFRARWRSGIARSAEAMTLFAVLVASIFPIYHLGRPWIFYWILPYPNQRMLWPNFQSPLIFDVLAVSTYLATSLLFWYTGLVPDFATVRDQARGLRKRIYEFLSMGWSGTERQWHHYGAAYVLLASLATALVISVHSVVSWDFALAIIPGYHSTIFPPYFVAGAIHSGLAMVLALLIPLRRIYRLEKIITLDALDKVARTSIFMALILGYSYTVEFFTGWLSGNVFERQSLMLRAFGYYGPLFWIMCLCAVVAPLFFFSGRVRQSPRWLFCIAIIINFGMWTERFIIIVGSMSHDFIPYAWGVYWPNWVDWSITFGSFCLFFLLFLLFTKFIPVVGMVEAREALGSGNGESERR